MFFFMMAPDGYRKILAVLDHKRGSESIAFHYVKRFGHLVPPGVELWEVAADGTSGQLVFPVDSKTAARERRTRTGRKQ